MQAGAIVAELAHRKTIANLFFPDAALNVSELRALVMRTSDLTEQQLAALSQETAEQLIERIKQIDTRWDYEVVTSPDRKPKIPSNATFSLSFGGMTINAFPRDIEALTLDPPTFTFTLKGSGIEKFRGFQRTGQESSFETEELGTVQTNLPTSGLFGQSDAIQTLRIGPSHLLRPKVPPLRLTFGSGEQQVMYEYMPFRFKRGGSDEVEIVTEGEGQPFTLSLVLHDTGCHVTFSEELKGASIKAIHKYLRALSALRATREIEAYNLQAGKRFFSAVLEGELPTSRVERFEKFFAYAARVGEYFNVDFRLNRDATEADACAVEQLVGIANGVLQLNRVQSKLVKDDTSNDLAWFEALVDMELEHPGIEVSVLDTAVVSGPFRVLTKVRLVDGARVKGEWDSIPAGAVLDVEWLPVGEATVIRT
jgi:hypothetical protein